MKKILNCIIFIISTSPVFCQQKTIVGKITELNTGKKLEGVIIRSALNHTQSISDTFGEFQIKTAGIDTLIFSRDNYEEMKIPVNNSLNDSLLVEMKKNNYTRLEDVIVNTGYQTIPQERSTGSFVQIDNNLFNRSTGPNVLDRLNGVANSVLFDNNSSHPPITIRGLGTLSVSQSAGTSSPLIVLDNFPYEGDINNINPNDIESITVLRDAAAASIWGAKAGNGVIVINTKKAHYNQPVNLSLNSNVTISQKPDLFAVSQMSTSDFIDVEQYLFANGFYDADLSDTQNWPIVSPVVEILNEQRNGSLSPDQATQKINALRKLDVRNDYLKYFYRPAVQQQYSIALSGGKESISYLSSFGFDKNLSSLVGDQDNRITWNTQLSLTPVKKLSIKVSMMSTWAGINTNSPLPINLTDGKNIYPYAQIADANNNALSLPKDFSNNLKDTAGGGNLLDWNYRPLQELNLADNSSKRNDLLLNFDANYLVSKFMNVEIKYQFENESNGTKDYYSQQTYFTRDLINLFSSVDGNNVSRIIPLGGILDLGNYATVSHSARTQIDYNRTFNRTSSISAIAGGEIRQSQITGSSYRTYGYNDENLTSSSVNFATQYPILDGLPFSPTIPNYTDFTGLLNRIVSVYANASYTYDNKYIFSLSARKDASNILGVSTNNKWKPLWSAGAAWKFSDEKFYHLTFLPLLKLRITYGYSGNVNNTIPALTTLDYTSLNYSGISNLPYAMVANPPNADLRWEKIGMFNAALDFSSKNNIVNGSIEYYTKLSTDVIAPVPADVTLTGSPSLFKNSADLKGKGVDLTLNSMILDHKFKWESSLLFSYNKVIVTKYSPYNNTPSSNVGEGGNILPIVGQNPYNVISYKWDGLNPENGNPQGFLNKQESEDYPSITSQATWNDLVIDGPAIPIYFGAFRNTFSYHHFSLSFNISYKLGYFFRKNTINYTNLFDSWIGNGDFEKRWQKPGDEKHTNVPSMVYPSDYYRDLFYQESDATVEKGDEIRLQDLNISYDLSPKNKKLNFHFYLYANNLGILWKANKDGLDPDANNGIPIPSSISVGCKINL